MNQHVRYLGQRLGLFT